MAGLIAYTLVVAVPAFLLSLLTPWLAWGWVVALLATSVHRRIAHADDPTEVGAFVNVALPAYAFASLMLVLWR